MKLCIFDKLLCLLLATLMTAVGPLSAADEATPERGLLRSEPGVAAGYTLISPLSTNSTCLIDPEGRVVHQWNSRFKPGLSAYLLPNGNLLRGIQVDLESRFGGGGISGGIQEFNWEGDLLWEFHLASDRYYHHHDFERLPNGNILLISWETRTKSEVLAVGRQPDYANDKGLWPATIVEIEPLRPVGARVVWQWHVWDHLIQDTDSNLPNFGRVADHPERVNINADVPAPSDPKESKSEEKQRADERRRNRTDWLHLNGIDYNIELDQIVVSSHSLSEIWIIDHSTTTEEAATSAGGRAGRGGDLLYRWGNPQIYRQGTADDQQLFHQHDPEWIPAGYPGAGNITIFNNGRGRTGGKDYSTVVEIATPVQLNGTYTKEKGQPFSPSEPNWQYNPAKDDRFYASFISGAHRVANGNTLICSGPDGRVFEVTEAGKIVWEYLNPFAPVTSKQLPSASAHNLFRATRIPPDHPALRGKELTPLEPQPKTSLELFREFPESTWKPLAKRQPEIHDDARVTFRVQAPKASKVLLRGDWLKRGEELAMAKDNNGVWSVTAGPFPPGNHIYGFEIDGAPVPDPENASVKLRATRSGSFFHIDGDAVWEPRDAPHGNVEINFQFSKELQETRWLSVYTPASYHQDTDRTYPVLYLLHGSNDTAIGWVMIGAANFILDNLIADGAAQEMIVVMPYGHAVPHGSPREIQSTNTDRFEAYLLNDVLPLVENKYRVRRSQSDRTIAGLSMGGGQAITIGLRNLDRFSAIGSFSGAVPRSSSEALTNILAKASDVNAQLDVLWLGCGRDDFLLERNKSFSAELTASGIDHELRLTEGVHNYAAWREYLAEFLPKLFQSTGQ